MSTGLLIPTMTPARPLAPTAFIEQRWVHYLILGSFLVLTLPLCLLAATDANFLKPWSLGWFYVCVLGTTHAALTLTIYLQSSNLSYFNSSAWKRVLYFLIPVGIFIFFDLYRALEIAVLVPVLDLLVRLGIRVMDFNHINRQSFGVFQLFKGRAKAFPKWLRSFENAYFLGLAVLLLQSHLTGGCFDINNWISWLLAATVAACFAAMSIGYVQAWRQASDRSSLVTPLLYLLMQSLSAVLAIINVTLYLCCLAMHYVEYHVLMYPRCFHTPLNPERRIDRFFAALRRRRFVFYGLLLGLAVVVSLCTWIGMGALIAREGDSPQASYLLLISVFDGLAVFHYFVEGLIWKFSDPHYRQTLGPLYFGPRRA